MDTPDKQSSNQLNQTLDQVESAIMPDSIISHIKQSIIKCLQLFIRAYQLTLSPLLGNHCRFYPSCSQYCHDALEEHGVWSGLLLGLKRIIRCHPGNPGGIDQVPKKSKSHG